MKQVTITYPLQVNHVYKHRWLNLVWKTTWDEVREKRIEQKEGKVWSKKSNQVERKKKIKLRTEKDSLITTNKNWDVN